MVLRQSILLLLCVALYANAETNCKQIRQVFANANQSKSFRCMDEGNDSSSKGMMIGCSGTNLASMWSTFSHLNETLVAKLRIWDSMVPTLVGELFQQLKPKSLTIERSMLSLIRPKALEQIGLRLKQLNLRHNDLQTVDETMLAGLSRLQVLDLSGNKLTHVTKSMFTATPDLVEIVLNDNEIVSIEAEAFVGLKQLKRLSINSNKLQTITQETFKGLDSLEVLQLQNNQISSVDWSTFARLKKLRVLDLGTNHLSQVDLRGLDSLQKLLLNNNSLMSLKSVQLRDLAALRILALDRNAISEIRGDDLSGLARSTRLESLILSNNNISLLDARAFVPVQPLSMLALQNNRITSLSTVDGKPIFDSLRKLHTLLLSSNQLKSVGDRELPTTLSVLALDHNEISNVSATAFEGISLQEFYLNNNRLKFLPKNSFDSFELDSLEAIDLTENPWECICSEEWLGAWLEKAGESDVGEGILGCLAVPNCGMKREKETEEEDSSPWITVVASILAVVSVVILIIIALLYVSDGRRRVLIAHPLSRRVDSDLHKLISNDTDLFMPRDVSAPTPRRVASGEKKKVRFEDN